ncbi:MAG: glycosyltransferase family 39 protein [bacterium]|nr:glycosyltransferase family 39 protein [bacterium]
MKKITFLTLLGILAVSVFFRFYQIKETPSGLYPDEAVNGVNALEALAYKDWKIFYPENYGREGLFINLQSISVNHFGAYPWALRIVSGIFGVLTVLGLFLLTRVLWGDRIALLSSYMMAISFWAVNFSRIGFRAIMLPFVLVWAFYFFWSGILKQNRYLIIVSGLIYGLGFHTYISWRLSPLLILLVFLMLLVKKDYNKKFILKSVLWFSIAGFIVMSPLALYYFNNIPDFFGRAGDVSIFKTASPAKAFAESAVKTLGMFNIYGDANWRHNLSTRPELFWPFGLGFIIGLASVLRRFTSDRNFFLISWFFVMLLPNFLAPEGAPHALRALGAMPAVFIMSAIGLNNFYNWAQNKLDHNSKNIKRIKKEFTYLCLLSLILCGVWEFRTYFVVWANKMQVITSFETRLTHIANYLNGLDSKTQKYVVVNETGSIIKGVSIQAQPIMFLAHKQNIKYLNTTEIDSIPLNLTDATIVLTKYDPELFQKIMAKYPKAHEANLITFKAIRIQ